MRTPLKYPYAFTLAMTGFLLARSSAGYSVEPLRGPETGQSWWSSSDSASTDNDHSTHERFVRFDVPIPTAIYNAMPFATFRYIDRDAVKSPRYETDQQLGLGLLHHSAEGDPAWRLDIIRGGAWATTPSFWTRTIVNLAKPFSWLKPRPSDTVFSWVGLNTIQKPGAKSLLIPELAWTRDGTDGISIDLVAPRHFLIGIYKSRFGVMAGAEQSLISYSTSTGEERSDKWMIKRLARLKFLAALSDEFRASVSVLKPWNAESSRKTTGLEIALQWNPNP